MRLPSSGWACETLLLRPGWAISLPGLKKGCISCFEQEANLSVLLGLLIGESLHFFVCPHTSVNVIQDRVGVSASMKMRVCGGLGSKPTPVCVLVLALERVSESAPSNPISTVLIAIAY